MDEQTVSEYVVKTRRKRELEAELKALKKEIDNMEPEVQEYFADTGFQSVRTGNGIAYLYREILANLAPEESGTHEEAHEALREHGLAYMIKTRVDATQLRAYVRRTIIEEEQDVPPGLERHLNIIDRYRIGVQK